MINLLTREKTKILFSTAILALTLLISNVLGLIRDRLLVAAFPTDVIDTYLAAFRVPDFIYNIFILGALSSAFLPVYTSLIAKKNQEEANKVASTIINFGSILVGITSLVIFFLAPFLVPYLVPGFSAEKIEVTVNLTRIMLVAPIFLGLSGVFSSILNSHKVFISSSLSPLFYNLGIIFGIKFLGDAYGIYGVSIGVLLGAFLHMAVQVPAVFKSGFKLNFIIDLKNSHVIKIFKLMIPRAVGLFGVQISGFVSIFIASTLKAGSITVFNMANNIQTLPMVVFGLAYSQALFPYFSHNAALEEKKELIAKISWGIRQILFWVIPATVGIIILRAQIVRLTLGVGNFTFVDTKLTAGVLAALVISLFAQSLIPLLARAFYALHETKIPVIIGLLSGAINIGLAFILTNQYFINFYSEVFRVPLDSRVVGLGLAFSIASIFNLVVLFIYLKKKIGELDGLKELVEPLFKIVIASTVMGYFVWKTNNLLAIFVDPKYPASGLLVQLLGGLLVGGVIYFGLAYLFRCEELKSIGMIFNRFKKHR